MIDHALVSVVLCFAFGYAIFALGPRTWKVRAQRKLADALSGLPLRSLQAMGRRLSVAATAAGKGGCGGCGSCAADAPAAPTSPGEVRVAPSAIGKRVHTS